MATPWGLTCLLIGLSIVEICNTHPMEQLLSGNEGPNGQIMGALVAVMVSVCIVFTLLACVCCKRRSGFKENENENEKKVFRNSPVSASVINETSLSGEDPGHVNPIANAEFTIFTPLSPPHHNNNVFRSQPPVICYTENEANPELNKVINPHIDGIDVSEWFAETEYNFPRNCLKYTRELGPGWFGRVVEGEALGISSPNTWTPVAVRILESSASAHEQAQFLLEAAVYRTEAHPHVLRLLGRSLEATPLLLIQELCPKGDLKRFLIENKELRDSEVMVGVPLRYCTQLAAAVQWLHEHNLPHLDLAARTCQISSDLSLKLGDYGLAVSHYPNDYYQGTPSIPVRWCAPESVNHTNTTLQPKQVSLEANIWSLAVTFWEICEWGRMPYDWLTDDEVISQVMDAPNIRLPQPSFNAYYIPPLYRLMEYCWLPSLNRPQINQIYSMLIHLSKTYTSSPTTSRATADFSTENFDLRWESFKPNTIIKTDNTRIKSASLTNLHGSFENLTEENETNNTVIQMDSWLENVASHTDDMQYVRGLSEAIHELDTALASEQTSSSSSFEPTPLSSLGAARSENILHMDDSSNLDSLIFPKRSESGSETEDETWKRRIERGAYSEKVRQKSKSVADLMVLTHIDMNTVRDIFQEELKKLQEERRESLLFVPVQSSEHENNLSASSNQSLEIEHSVTEPSIRDSKLEQIISDTKINLERENQENRNNFDTFLQANIESNAVLTPEQENKNQNILNNDVPEIILTEHQKSTEKNVEHIEIISIPKNTFPLVQDFINTERRCENSSQIQTEINASISQIENIKIESKNTNLEAAPTEKLQTLQDKIEKSKIESEISELNSDIKDLDIKDRENIALQVNEILQQAEKSVLLQQPEMLITNNNKVLEAEQILSNEVKENISNEQELQQSIDNKDKENISLQASIALQDAQKSVSFLEPSHIKHDDTKKEENIVQQEIIHNQNINDKEVIDNNTEQAKKSVTFSELTTNEVVNSEKITRDVVPQQNLSREDEQEITSQVNEILQEAENNVNNRLNKNEIESPVKEIKRMHKENDNNGTNDLNEDVKKITHDFLSNEQQNQNKLSNINTNIININENKNELIKKEEKLPSEENIKQISEIADLRETQKEVTVCNTPKDSLVDETNLIDISPSLIYVDELKQPRIQNVEIAQQNIESVETQNILLKFDEPTTESKGISAVENKSQLLEDIECPTKSIETSPENSAETLNILLKYVDLITESKEISPVENTTQFTEEIECPTKFAEVAPSKSAETTQENIVPIERTNILLQFDEPTTESKEILIAEIKTQFTEDIEYPTKCTEISQENIVPIKSSNILLKEPTTESKEILSVKNETQLTGDIECPTKSVESSQENVLPIESTNISLHFVDPTTENNRILVKENKTQLTENIECSTKSTETSQENIIPIESSNILLQFEVPATECKETSAVEKKSQLIEDVECPRKPTETSQENIIPIESTNILLQFDEPTTESKEILTAVTKTQLTANIECPTKSAEPSQENVPIESSNILLQFEDFTTENKEISPVENKSQLIEDIECPTKSTEVAPTKSAETTQENILPIERTNILLQFDEPTTESKEILTAETKTQLTADIEYPTKCTETSQENTVPIESSNILLQFEDSATESKETYPVENKSQLIEDIECPTKSAETSQENIVPIIEKTNILLQFDESTTGSKEILTAETKTQLTADIGCTTKSTEISQENIVPIERTNILLQFEDPATDSKEIPAVKYKSHLIEDIECSAKSTEVAPTKSAETSQENIVPNERTNILLQFDEPTTESKEVLTAGTKTQLTADIEYPTKSTDISQENVSIERTNILLQFEDPATESKEIPAVEKKSHLIEDIECSAKSTEVAPTKSAEKSQENIVPNERINIILQFDEPTTESKEILTAGTKTQLTADIEYPTKSADISQENVSIERTNILLQFEDPATESKEIPAVENKSHLIEDIECSAKSTEIAPTKSAETSQENIVPNERTNILLQFDKPTTESKEILTAGAKPQLTADIECPTKSTDISQENIVPIERTNILLQFEDPATESKEIPAVENKSHLIENIECSAKSTEVAPTKSAETSQENIVPSERTNILSQFDEPTTESKEVLTAETETYLTADIKYPPKSAEKSQENIVPIERTSILLQFEDPATESKEIPAVENKTQLTENVPQTISTTDYLNSELYQDSMVMPDLIETLNKEQNLDLSSPFDISLQSNEPIKQDDVITESHINNPEINVKSTEYSTIQNFINNERNNNQEDLIPTPQVETKQEKTEPTPVDITADLLDLDDSNIQRINQVFNVFSVTVDHKPPLECFSPVKSYLHPFDQNDLMTDINCLLESEKKYESKNIPFVNGITCEVSNKFIDILVDSSQPKKLAEIALNSLKSNIDQHGMKSEEKLTNGYDEKAPKKLSELALESFKTNSLSEDSGFASVQCEDKITNGIKDSEDTSEDILKISVDSLEDILSNSDENECEAKDVENLRTPDELVTSFAEEETQTPKKLSELVQDTLSKTYEVSKETHHLPDLILDNMQTKLENCDVNADSSLKSLSDKEESDKTSPLKLSEIILDSLPCNSPVTSESTDNFSEKTVIDVNKISDNGDSSDIYDEEISFPTSTPFKQKNPETTDNFFSFVSEGDEPSDCQTHVILGPCEEYGLGLYSGLKTTFGKFSDDDRPEEEILQFSSNFMPFTEAENSVDYSLETWDKFLGKSLQDQDNCPSSVFDNFSPRPESLDVFKKKEDKDENLNKTVTINKNDKTFTIENEAPLSQENKDKSQTETTQSNWEPGEGWFLHPQAEVDDLTGQIDISTAEIDNSYVGFALDKECENALRNELAAKLPHAQGMSHEEPQEPEDWDTEERSEIIVKYNVYATPLSPIPEESCCDDVYCDQMQHRDGSDSDSDWSEPGLGHTSQLEDILVVDTETHTALILESPSLREPQHRHTPSQDSCCSNDTLFNLEDLNYGLSPQHHGTLSTTHSQDSDHILEIEITEDTPKHTPTKKLEDNSDSTEMNLTYTKPDINIDESEESNLDAIMESQAEPKPEDTKTKLELKLDPNAIGVAPLPSPEDIPWRQLPASLLTYNEVTQNDKFGQDSEETTENVEENNLPEEITNDDLSDRECTIEADLYSNLTDIRFSGPCDAQLMSTSFSEDAEERDWDSGSDTRSSSSGEFIWKEGEHEESLRALHAASHDVSVMEEINPMDAIDEENSNTSDSDDCEEDEIEETDFVPSAWDAQATPTKSAMRSPEKSNKRKNQQKGVWFKKQKYHCVYEYPREPESPVAPPGDLWRPLSDLSNFTDWELDPDSCIAPSYDDPDGAYDVLDKFITRSGFPLASGSSRHRDLYQLNPFPDFGPCIAASDEDFFISSSARPFQSVGQSSQFFPGQQPPKSKFLWQDYQSSSQQSSRDLSEGITPDSGIDDITPASISDIGVEILPRHHVVPPLKCLAAIAADKTRKTEEKNADSSLGGLRHTRNRLKLDLPPSPNSFTSNRTFSIDVNNDPVVNREIPTFSTFGKTRFSVQHVSTPTEEIPDPLQPGKSKCKNVSFEALPHKPMKLTEKVYIMDNNPEEENHKPVEMVQGEASLLDSADEDSGIESSANATLERHQQQILN